MKQIAVGLALICGVSLFGVWAFPPVEVACEAKSDMLTVVAKDQNQVLSLRRPCLVRPSSHASRNRRSSLIRAS